MWTFKEMLPLLQDPETLISSWEQDPLLVKRVSGDLVIVNASKRLFTPTTIEQALAKGVVYHKATRQILSVPFPKMWNLEENESFHLQHMRNGGEYQILSKEDGTLIQSFWVDNQIILTTRGSMQGTHEEDSSHLNLAHELWEKKNPLTHNHPQNTTLIWELVGPNNPIIQPYLEDKLILIGAYDQKLEKFLTYKQLQSLSSSVADNLTHKLTSDNLPKDLEGVEGWVVSLIHEGKITHSFKVKTHWWRQQMRSKCNVTVAEVMRRFLADDSLRTFEDLWFQLMSESGQEELKDSWLNVWEQALTQIQPILDLYAEIPSKLKEISTQVKDPNNAKEIALYLKQHNLPTGLYMSFWRGKPSRLAVKRFLFSS